MTGIHIGDIGKLGIGAIQELCLLNAVSGCLIEHHNELRVGQHRSCRMGLEQIVHILRDAGSIDSVLTDTLPKREQAVGAVLVLEQQLKECLKWLFCRGTLQRMFQKLMLRLEHGICTITFIPQ